jgi:HAD superfamily phosphatase (TIGR01668 family)
MPILVQGEVDMDRIAKIFQPHLIFDQITDIDLKQIIRFDIKAILLDTDGTFTHLGSSEVSSDYCQWIKEAAGKIPLQSLTCNHERRNLNQIASAIGQVPLQRHMFEHPKRFFYRASRHLGFEPSQVAIINDSLFILGLYARPLGCLTIKVSSINFTDYISHSPIGCIYRLGQWTEKHFILPHLARS